MSSVGQLLIVGFAGTAPTASLVRRLRRGEVGGVILFSRNFENLHQLANLVAELHAAAPPEWPLLVCVDQEGGRVQRIREPLPVWPPMRVLGERDDAGLTHAVGRAIGRDLKCLGFNVDFAPVLDVVSSAKNVVIGDRSIGSDPHLVAKHGLALARGLLEGGVLPCGKHFPGHGGPVADSHLQLPTESRTFEQMNAIDFVPFRELIAAEVMPLLMTAHVAYAHWDSQEPATFSHKICSDLLRREFQFQGTLISDDLEMKAIAASGSARDVVERSLMAGVDMFIVSAQEQLQEETFGALQRLSEDDHARHRIDESLGRVRNLKSLPQVVTRSSESLSDLEHPKRHATLLRHLGS